MTARRAFLSLTSVDRGHHTAFNAWHQLDHRPENLALPGVIWGERWVKSPDCDEFASGSEPELLGSTYANIYWFRDPASQSLDQFHELGQLSYQWGRRPELPHIRRRLTQLLVPVKGYVAARVFVSPDVLPLRPNRGVHLTVSDWSGDIAEIDERFRSYDRERAPALLECPGVAGIWTLANEEALRAEQHRSKTMSCTRVTILFFDEDPLEVTAALPPSIGDNGPLERVRFAAPLRAIVPWQWDWFDER